MSKITFLFSLVLALLLAGTNQVKAEVTFGNFSQESDGRTYCQTTFTFDLKQALSSQRELLDDEWIAKVKMSAAGKVTVSGSAKDVIYLAGQLTNKPGKDPDVGLSWDPPKWIKMDHLENGIYEATVKLLAGRKYDYKFVASDKTTFTKDPNNPESEPGWGNSQITVPKEYK